MVALAQKVSVSVPGSLLNFVKAYKKQYHLRSDSEVMTVALRQLQKAYLEQCYIESAAEIKNNSELKKETELWDNTTSDGLESEGW